METDLKIGKIIVHVGLPKTATTSMQVNFFPEMEGEDVCYLGVRHPRSETIQDSTFECFIKSLITGDVEVIRDELFGLLSEGKTIILSEEMITVSLNNVSWRTKLMNLSKILEGMNYLILLTVREPVSAMFSYYVEMLSHKQKIGKKFIDVAKHDERMEIFHYGKLANELIGNFEVKRIHIEKFEDIINGEVEGLANCFVGAGQSWVNSKISKINDKKQSQGYVYTGNKTTMADAVDSLIERTNLKKISFFKKYKNIYKYIHRRVGNFVVAKGVVKKPSEKQFNELKMFLVNENKEFSRAFDVYYE